MREGQPVPQDKTDEGTYIMDLLLSLLEEQTGEKYEYQVLPADVPKYQP